MNGSTDGNSYPHKLHSEVKVLRAEFESSQEASKKRDAAITELADEVKELTKNMNQLALDIKIAVELVPELKSDIKDLSERMRNQENATTLNSKAVGIWWKLLIGGLTILQIAVLGSVGFSK